MSMWLWLVLGVWAIAMGGCQSTESTKPLAAPVSANSEATRHNNEGIQAFDRSQWKNAREHFEEAIKASPNLAEAHYNLGMTLYKLRAFAEADPHFIEAANLAPGNKIIWNAPPLRNVIVPTKEAPLSDGHSHQH